MIKPLANYVLLEPIKEEKKKSAILVPEHSEKEQPGKGKVVGVGSDKKVDVKKGDIVFYKKYSEQRIKDGEKEYIAVKFEDLIAVQ